jgi:phenylalanyl-tRNA synthetase alpha chain
MKPVCRIRGSLGSAKFARGRHSNISQMVSATVPILHIVNRRFLHTESVSAKVLKELSLNSTHPSNNIPPSIASKIGRNLHLRLDHPLGQLKKKIQSYFEKRSNFKTFDNMSPIVSRKQNFDDLLTPVDHPSRAPTDTFYVNDSDLLRCHMTAHQTDLIRQGESGWLMIGDVYRRDEIDATHYPVFHQVDGVRVWRGGQLPSELSGASPETIQAWVIADLKNHLEGLMKDVFGSSIQIRWIDAYFPFTDPSLEMEIFFQEKWLEVLGSGMIRLKILENSNASDAVGWAFGIGLERIAMILHNIPDIRLFWSQDERFISQFTNSTPENPVKFQPYSKYPACYKDITFWIPSKYHVNDFYALIREVGGDLIENVILLDQFTHPKNGKVSHCYRINYRSMDQSLTNEEVDVLQAKVRNLATDKLQVQLR